jgi:hypothetical protein
MGETVPLPRESLLGLSEQGISSVLSLSRTQTGSYSLAPAGCRDAFGHLGLRGEDGTHDVSYEWQPRASRC